MRKVRAFVRGETLSDLACSARCAVEGREVTRGPHLRHHHERQHHAAEEPREVRPIRVRAQEGHRGNDEDAPMVGLGCESLTIGRSVRAADS